MRFGINCIQFNPTYRGGINTYTFGLLEGLARVGAQHSFQIYATPKNYDAFARFQNLPNFQVIKLPVSPIFLRGLVAAGWFGFPFPLHRTIANLTWRKAVALQESLSDLIYTPTTNLFPYCYKIPTLISMHDIQYLHFPHFFSFREMQTQRIAFGLSVRHVNFIQSSCEFIKQDILQHFPHLTPHQFIIIRDGIDTTIWQSQNTTPRSQIPNLPPDKYLFYPAQLWPHKDHLTVLKALKLLKDRDGMTIPLVLTGASYGAASEIFKFIESSAMQNQVKYLGKVPLDHLKTIYHNAHFIITATIYESNSLTLLEAAAMQRPLIASNTPPNVELADKLQINLFQVQNPADLADLLKRIWLNDSLITRQVLHNNTAMAYFSWDRVAIDYLNFCQAILKRRA